MAVPAWILSAVNPLLKLFDDLHMSKEEKAQAQTTVYQIQAGLAAQAIEYETELAQAKSAIIVAEAQSESAITRSWRPIVILSLTFIVIYLAFLAPVCNALFEWNLPQTFAEDAAPDQLWDIIKIALGGYIGGRTLEKIAREFDWEKVSETFRRRNRKNG